MKTTKRLAMALMAACGLSLAWGGDATAATPIKIGVLNDMSGLYADLAGPGSLVAAQLAVEDFGAAAKGLDVQIVGGDHQNKADIGSNIARQWFDQDGVDVIVDVPNSAVALAVSAIAREKNKVLLVTTAGTSDLTGKACSPNTIHWTYDTWALANGTGSALVARGDDTWYFLTADYTFGHALERDTTAAVTNAGGKVLGSIAHPFPGSDFSSFLLQAQASGAKVIGLANAGGDTINSIKQAAEFGIVQGGQKLAGLLVFLSDIHGLGLQTAQGLVLTETFYWDLNDGTRDFARRFAERNGGKYPTMAHAGAYAGVLHYLKTVAALGDKQDGAEVVKEMKALPTDDPLFGKGSIRADGRKLHNAYLFQVKTPEESKGPYDYYNLLATIPADKAFRPEAEGGCSLVAG